MRGIPVYESHVTQSLGRDADEENIANKLAMDGSKCNDRLRTIADHLFSYKRTSYNSATSQASAVVHSPSTYDFVLQNNLLTEEQVRFYNENGFLVVRNLVSSEDIRRYVERFRQICMKEVVIPGILVMKDVTVVKSEFLPQERAVNKLQDFQNDEVLFSYCQLPQILKYVECFTGPDIKVIC